MYNLDSEFKKFYGEYVVLPQEKKNELFRKRDLNIKRLRDGLKEYNDEKGTNYQLKDHVVQGSVAMSTVIQSEEHDYDIDVAIIFDKDNLPEGTTATKNMVVDALKRKTAQFATEPEAKTNCVRIQYQDNYHVDFAIYRRWKDKDGNFQYEHCGSEWRRRDPRAITQWFNERNEKHNYRLREVVRLLKMFCKSRNHWRMPSGLILTVLAEEQVGEFCGYERMDERFYYTIKAIRNRLLRNKEIYNPTDASQSLLLTKEDKDEINNLYKRLDEHIGKLDVLFRTDCTFEQAVEAWEEFFNHEYWTKLKEDGRTRNILLSESKSPVYDYGYKETEEYIEHLFPIDLQYELRLDCKVTKKNGEKVGMLSNILARHELLIPGYNLDFIADTNTPPPYDIYWKVRNRGDEAKKRNMVRGQICKTNSLTHREETSFKGQHYVECYIVKDGIVVAKRRINVPIKVG